eukprot:Partr_v1_DN25763_c1_g1_i1_m74717 putative transcription factor
MSEKFSVASILNAASEVDNNQRNEYSVNDKLKPAIGGSKSDKIPSISEILINLSRGERDSSPGNLAISVLQPQQNSYEAVSSPSTPIPGTTSWTIARDDPSPRMIPDYNSKSHQTASNAPSASSTSPVSYRPALMLSSGSSGDSPSTIQPPQQFSSSFQVSQPLQNVQMQQQQQQYQMQQQQLQMLQQQAQSQLMQPPMSQLQMQHQQNQSNNVYRKTRENLPKTTTTALKNWLMTHAHNPYPTENQKRQMCDEFSLTAVQLNNWFINGRRRYLKRAIDDKTGQSTLRYSPSVSLNSSMSDSLNRSAFAAMRVSQEQLYSNDSRELRHHHGTTAGDGTNGSNSNNSSGNASLDNSWSSMPSLSTEINLQFQNQMQQQQQQQQIPAPLPAQLPTFSGGTASPAGVNNRDRRI